MVINGGAIQFTDSDRENFTVKKYTDEEIKCNSEQFLKKRKKKEMCFFNHINGARVNKVFGLENQMCYRHCIVILFFCNYYM